MKHLYTTAILVVATVTAFSQSKPKVKDTAHIFLGEFTYPKIDTITVVTYCVNPETLDVKWFKVQAITGGWEYPYMTFNDALFIYKKYLNVPKGYKAVYSIAK